jgi:tetratricopeptide (TPR) repeat protein
MKNLLMIVPVLLFLTGNAQVNRADSLKQGLRSAPNDTLRVNALNDLAGFYMYSRPDTCLVLAQELISLSKKAKYEKGEADGLNMMGNIFSLTGDYPKSLEYYLEALKRFEKLHNREGMSKVYGNIGIIYGEQGDNDKAIPYFRKSRSNSLSGNTLARSLLDLGDSYEKLNQLDSARIYTNQAYEMALRINYIPLIGIALNNLGNIHSKMKQDRVALEYYHLSLPVSIKNEDIDVICETTMGMAEIFKRAGRQDSAFYYARFSQAAANKAGFLKRLLNASSFISDYYKGLNRLDSAYRYQQITIAAKDSLFSQQKVKAFQNLAFQEQIRQQEIAEASRKAAEERSANIQMLGIGTFITFFFGFLFVFGRKKSNQKVVQFLGLMGLLLLFEFISLFMHPYIAAWTHHIPVLMLLVLAGIASVLVPLHHRLQELVRERLAKKMAYVNQLTIDN